MSGPSASHDDPHNMVILDFDESDRNSPTVDGDSESESDATDLKHVLAAMHRAIKSTDDHVVYFSKGKPWPKANHI